jgi:hypothetical protein
LWPYSYWLLEHLTFQIKTGRWIVSKKKSLTFILISVHLCDLWETVHICWTPWALFIWEAKAHHKLSLLKTLSFVSLPHTWWSVAGCLGRLTDVTPRYKGCDKEIWICTNYTNLVIIRLPCRYDRPLYAPDAIDLEYWPTLF